MNKIRPLYIFLFIALAQSPSLHSSIQPIEESGEIQYLRVKEAGDYLKALEILHNNTLRLKDPLLIEVNVFRIFELARYPELYQKCCDILKNIRKTDYLQKQRDVLDRIDMCISILLLKLGELEQSKKIIDSFSFMDFLIAGPFKSNTVEDFERSYPPERGFRPKDIFRGKTHVASWFPATKGRTGVISVHNFHDDTNESFFYFFTEFKCIKTGTYYFSLGKTGYTDIWLDGKKIFSDRTEHRYRHDQYRIKVHLPNGNHRIIIKAGNASGRIALSMRCTDSRGRRIKHLPASTGDTVSPGHSTGISYFPSLNKLLKGRDTGSRNNFLTGYLFYISGLDNDRENPAYKYLSRIKESDPYYTTACLYTALSERSTEKREALFRKAVKAEPKNLEALYGIITIKLNNNYIYEANELIEQLNRTRKNTHFYLTLSADLFMKQRWFFDAAKSADSLIRSRYPSTGYRYKYRIDFKRGDYSRAVKNLQHLLKSDMYNRSYYRALIQCYEKTGMNDNARRALHQAIAIFPDDVQFRLHLARLVEHDKGPAYALPYLSSALKISPLHRDVLQATGMVYHKLNNTRLALYYLRLASHYDPDNFSLKQYIKGIDGTVTLAERYRFKKPLSLLRNTARQYSDEGAVILLDECILSVNSDGSYEEHIRKIIQINDKSALRDYQAYHIVYDPTSEQVENIRCTLYNNAVRTAISERYKRSLSDPRSRVYYDLESIIIPFATAGAGTVIDIEYVIKNRGGNEYKNYFGKKIILGDNYRTLNSNIVLIHPTEKTIYCHLTRIRGKYVSRTRISGKKICRINIGNIKPYKKERAMPHHSEINPIVYFTSHRNWDELYSWYRSLLKNKIRVDKTMEKKIDSILSRQDTPLKKAADIYKFVTSQIRYVGFEFGIGGIQPRSTDMTFSSGMGDCKDVALLLVALLRYAGIKSQLALIRTRDKGRPNLTVPYIGEFNHAICFVDLEGGFFIDGTARETGLRELPDDDRGCTVMLIGNNTYRFKNTASPFYLKSRIEAENSVQIKSDGSAVLRRKLIKKGDVAPEARYTLMNSTQREKDLEGYWNNVFTGSMVRNLKIEDTETDKPVIYSYTVEIPHFAQPIDTEIIFNSTLTPSKYYQDYGLLKQRKFPLLFSSTWETVITTTYSAPSGYEIIFTPKDEEFIHDKFVARFHYSRKGTSVTVRTYVAFKSYRIETGEYPDFREFVRFINTKELERIIIAKSKNDQR